jgi:hypothetical protein
MNEDSVLQEVRAAREAYARSHGYDVRAMVADLRERDDRGDWPVVRLVPRRSAVPGASQSGPDLALQRTRPAEPLCGTMNTGGLVSRAAEPDR